MRALSAAGILSCVLALWTCRPMSIQAFLVTPHNAMVTIRYSSPSNKFELQTRLRGDDDEMIDRIFFDRRSFMTGTATAMQLWLLPTIAHGAMENTQTVFKAGQTLSMAEAEARFKEGQKSAKYLLDHYDEICEGGGDNVRRYLGTVGTTSGLYGIAKVMSILSDKADDFVEYTELSDEILKSIQQADGSAYMAIFVTTSTSQTPPSKYFGDAKIEVKRCIKGLDELAALIGI